MENLKIRIPCEEVSKLVQEKAFMKGCIWGNAGKTVQHREKPFLFLSKDGFINFACIEDTAYFEKHANKEISWQEFLYGEGFYFKTDGGDEAIYFQARKDSYVYWCYDNYISETQYGYKEHLGSGWIETDMFGNKLEEKEMNFTKDDLVVGKHVVEYANDSKKFLYLGDKFVTLNGGFMWSRELTKDLTDKDLDLSWDVTKVYKVDIDNVTNLSNVFDHLVLVWKREAPKPVKEMTLAEVCKELGYDVKIKKD